MGERVTSVQSILLEALEIDDPRERAAFVSEACGADQAMLREVEELIRAGGAARGFLPERPANEAARGMLLDALENADYEGAELNGFAFEKPGDRIGRYKILQKLGQGGCGVVYMAEQEEPVRRRVALKIIKVGMDTRNVVARFEAERQALALMDHPNIAKVFDAGATETGRPFFVMELVSGTRITEYCDRHQLPADRRLELFIQVCQAVQHAHQKGVIHRDLKPSNILVTTNDGTPLPKVIDFGIAKATEGRLTGLTLATAFEQLLGTPAYMSPEQAALSSHDIDTRSDIYSLGVLLYELLTGKTPFDTRLLLISGLDELRRTIREDEPMRPSTRVRLMLAPDRAEAARERQSEPPKLVSLLRGDLDWIVMKCLEKDRARRYETANGLARDIQRYLNCEPVLARPPSKLYEFQKTVRRHKFGFAAAAAIMLTLAVGALVSTWQAVQKGRERQRFENNVVRQYVNNGTELVNSGDLFGALLWYAEALKLDAGDPRREEPHRIRLASILRQCPKLLNVISHGKMLYYAEFSPDGSKVLTVSDDHTARLWDATTGRQVLKKLTHDGEVYHGTFSPDGARIVTSGEDKTARIWDARTGELLRTLRHKDIVWWSSFSPDGRLLATGSRDQTAQLWNPETGEELGGPLKHDSEVEILNFSPDGRLLATSTGNGVAHVWDVVTHEERFQSTHFGGGYSSVPFAQTGDAFLTSDGRSLHIRDTHSFKELPFSPLPFPNIHAATFSPDGHSIVAASDDFIAQVWDAASGKPLFTPPVRHKAAILNARVSPDGRYLATAGQDTVAQVWSTATGQRIGPPLKFIIHVKMADFNPDGRRLLGNSCDQAVRVWDLATGDLTGPSRQALPNEHRIISSDGTRVLLKGASNLVCVVDTSSGRAVASLPHPNAVSYASFSRDGQSVLTACSRYLPVSTMASDILLWDARTGRRLNQGPMGHPFTLLYAAFSLDNRRLLTCGFDFTARLWDAHTGRPLSDPLPHREVVWWGAFSPDGQSVVTTSLDHSARVWDAATGKPLTPPLEHKSGVLGAFWSADGRRLTTITVDDYLQVWDLSTGLPLTPPRKAPESSENLFAYDGQIVARKGQEDLQWDDRPVDDLVLLARMLAVSRIDAVGNVVPLELRELTGAERKLRPKYPDQFSVSAQEKVAWHRHQAQQSRSEGNTRAAMFHLERAVELSSADPALILERAVALARAGVVAPTAVARELSSAFPARDSKATLQQIDLSAFYNLRLGESLNQKPDGNDLAEMQPGLLTLGGVLFDARGIVHLSGQAVRREGQVFPERMDGIHVGQKCRRLHFLQAAAYDAEPGTEVGKYVLHYTDGQQRELPIVFGRDLQGWWVQGVPSDMLARGGAVPVWAGNNLLAAKNGYAVCLYDSIRENPRPDAEVASIDFVSSMSAASPFLVALTLNNSNPTRRISDPGQSEATGTGEWSPSRRSTSPAAASAGGQIDLSPHYNVPLHNQDGTDFGELRAGRRVLGGVPFDIRGVVHLNGRELQRGGSQLPERINGIAVAKQCRRLHFLQGMAWEDAPRGTQIGTYVLHYADGQQTELPIVSGQDAGSWWAADMPEVPLRSNGALPVWSGKNRTNAKDGCSLYLYKSTRENPRPNVELSSVDFVSTMTSASLFLVALTVD